MSVDTMALRVSHGGDGPPRGSGRILLRDVRLDRVGPHRLWGGTPQGGAATEHLDEHTAALGPRPRGSAELVDALDRAGLTGYGGAHVSTALKWRTALRAGGASTVVANGAESEPLSAKDATLLQQRPHLVIDGLLGAAEPLGAPRAVFWLHGDDEASRVAVHQALAQRRPATWGEPRIDVVVRPQVWRARDP